MNDEVLLVGRGFEQLIEVLGAHYHLLLASDEAEGLGILSSSCPDVVLVHAEDAAEKLALARALARPLRDSSVPLLVTVASGERLSRREVLMHGGSDCLRLDAAGEDILAQVTLHGRLHQLAETVLSQRTMLARRVDDLVQARDELHAARWQLETLLEHGPMIMYSVEAPTVYGGFATADEIEQAAFSYVDESVATLLGYRADQLVGQGDKWRRLVPEADRRRLSTRARRLLARGEHACEYRVRHVDGKLRWISDEARLLRGASGAVTAVVGCMRDVTSARRATEALRRSGGLLRSAQRMHGAQRIAGTVAHDFNNLLAVIMCHGQYAARLLPTEHPAQQSLEAMLEAVARARAGTRLLVQLSRQSAKRSGTVKVGTVIRRTLKLVEPLLGEGIRILVKVRSGLPRVRIDRLDLEQALVNLCVNARDAMPTGGTLTVRADWAQLYRDAELPSPSSIAIEVSDSGIGMDDRVLARCFEPFFTTKRESEGTGLGLFSILQTLRQWGGTVALETEQGRGTTVRLFLPAVQRVGASTERTVSGLPLSGKSAGSVGTAVSATVAPDCEVSDTVSSSVRPLRSRRRDQPLARP